MKHKTFPFWMIGVAIGILFMVVGFMNDQFTNIFRKAVMICLECIGLG